MTRDRLILIAALGSAALLAGAFGAQYIGGQIPCELCLLERWPHAIAILLGIFGLILPFRWVAALGALDMAASAGLGLYHTGVQMKWWPGPEACTSAMNITGASAKQLYDQLMTAPIVRCDSIGWTFAGLTMPAWNAIFSALLFLIWLVAAVKRPRPALNFKA